MREWKIMNDIIPTKSNIMKKGIDLLEKFVAIFSNHAQYVSGLVDNKGLLELDERPYE